MRRVIRCLLLILLPGIAAAQQTGVSADQLKAYAKAYAEIGKLRDRYEAEFAEPRNKKIEAMQELHGKLRQDVARVLQSHNFTQDQYDRITFAISTDPEQRKAFDLLLGIAPPAPAPAATMHSNPHVGHVMNSFPGAPNAQGLLPLALAEAKVVVQHAGLAARNTGSLDALKLHAGHVLHALQPAEGTSGPGAGFGLKKAAELLAAHIELAAKTNGATPNVVTHSVHVAAEARNTAQRADQIAALAREIQSSSNVDEAVALMGRLNALVAQVMPGLETIQEHLGLLTR